MEDGREEERKKDEHMFVIHSVNLSAPSPKQTFPAILELSLFGTLVQRHKFCVGALATIFQEREREREENERKRKKKER